MPNLTPKQLNAREKRFVEEYLIDLDPERAAIEAGYAQSVASSKAYCWVSNSKSNDKPHVYDAVAEAQEKLSSRTKITQERVIEELARIGFSNIGNYIDYSDGGVILKPSESLTEDDLRCVAEVTEVSTDKGGNVKFKLYDKVGALDKIMRHLGGYQDRIDHTSGGEKISVRMDLGDAGNRD